MEAGGRKVGSLIKQVLRKEAKSGDMFPGMGISSLTILIIAEKGFRSKLGGFPCKSSIKVQPTDQMSLAEVT